MTDDDTIPGRPKSSSLPILMASFLSLSGLQQEIVPYKKLEFHRISYLDSSNESPPYVEPLSSDSSNLLGVCDVCTAALLT